MSLGLGLVQEEPMSEYTEVDSKAPSCSQMVAKAVTRFQVDQIALELDKVVSSLSCHWSSHLGPNPNTCQHQEWKI